MDMDKIVDMYMDKVMDKDISVNMYMFMYVWKQNTGMPMQKKSSMWDCYFFH